MPTLPSLLAQSTGLGVAMSAAPIVLLILLMTKRNPWASYKALPLTAGILLAVKLFFFRTDATLCMASIITGLLSAWKPLLIVWGAIFLFRTMEHSGSMGVIRTWLNHLTSNSIAQFMLIGWAFSFLIEGVAGFGTPAALAAPILVGLGHRPLRVAVLCLIMNSVPVSFAAAGVPTWFGFSQLDPTLSAEMMMDVTRKTAVMHFAASLIIPVVALRFVTSWHEIRKHLGFIYISILACTLPLVIIAQFTYEFPTMAGGLIGVVVIALCARYNIGLPKDEATHTAETVSTGKLARAAFPIWGTILVLLITRMPGLDIGSLLKYDGNAATFSVGFAEFSISPAFYAKLTDILGIATKDGQWSHAFLHIPSLIPFFLVSVLAFWIYRMPRKSKRAVASESWNQMKKPILALSGGLVMVKLLTCGGQASCTTMMGQFLGATFGSAWTHMASYLGALGAFFSGSNTVSNLMFGQIQRTIATEQGLNVGTILAQQSIGGAMGNMTCINNIVAVCSVLGLSNVEGDIIKRTVIPMVLYGVIAAAVAAWLLPAIF